MLSVRNPSCQNTYASYQWIRRRPGPSHGYFTTVSNLSAYLVPLVDLLTCSFFAHRVFQGASVGYKLGPVLTAHRSHWGIQAGDVGSGESLRHSIPIQSSDWILQVFLLFIALGTPSFHLLLSTLLDVRGRWQSLD